MSVAWIVATPDSRDAYDTEAEAERKADEMVKSRRAPVAVVYRVDVEDQQ